MEEKIEVCKITCIHKDVVDKVKDTLIEDEKITYLEDFFKVFGDGTRLKILIALSRDELCVCDLAYLLDMNQSAISHQLRILKQARLVKYRKDGKVVYYSLLDEHVKDIIATGLEHISER